MNTLKVGDIVTKHTGDYSFEGQVVAVFNKLKAVPSCEQDGPVRVVVQNKDGILHIFSPGNLTYLRRQIL